MESFRNMFKVIGEVVGKNRRLRGALTAIAVCVVLGTCGWCVYAYIAPALQGGQAASGEGADASGADAGGDAAGAEADGTATDKGDPASSAAKATSEYTGVAKTVATMLCGYTWSTDGAGTSGVAFGTDGTVYMKVSGKTEAFTVSDAQTQDTGTTKKSTLDGSFTTTTNYSFILTVGDSDPAAATLTNLTTSGADGSEKQNLTLRCSSLSASTLRSSASTDSIEISDATGKLGEALGAGVDEVAEKVKEWCGEQTIGASTATWDGTATKDWASGAVSVKLQLDNTTRSTVTVTAAEDGSLTVSKVS